ncbi:ketopantoate reductase family protein [Nocardioides sp. cx-173]|uniref:ketopantoate reductase family protein n=1 Tax=Nocardioides sp. cx-173 TaxID=2898796 RepID=UPI001E4BAE8E|nr:ketopantoate reductase family protein [Nocardioides sp. cx-173]MCD4525682.1 ketopantoate reductase family protein [Nocardioides sp. cx-173]UGB42820.1 ketopantoate reductase family protein [Nocardioides sp. cx-173]
MKVDMRYVVYGTGAVGGVIGGNLHLAGVPVTLVARGEHLARIRAAGLVLDRADGRHRVDAPTAETAANVAWTDDTVVLLCVKGHQTQSALDDLRAHAPAVVTIACVQNGVANELTVLRRYAATYGVCVMLPATHLEPGVVVQKCYRPGILDLGLAAGGVDARAEAIAADLRRGGFESVPRPDIMAWKHRKLLMNLGNGVGAVCTPGPAADDLARRAREEGEQVLRLAGVPVVTDEEDRERRGDLLARRQQLPVGEGGSTWQSVVRGGRGVEIDYLAGEIVLLGRLHGVPTPVNEAIQRATHDLVRSGGAPRSVDPATVLPT